jgi:cell division septal protein FtsQ
MTVVLGDALSVRSAPNDTPPGASRFSRLAAGVRRQWVRIVRGLGLAGGLCFGGWMAATALPAASFLAVDSIVVRGNEQLSDGEVLTLMSGLRGAAILSVDLAEHQRRLAASPWLAGVTLRRRLPSTVEVLVRERRPVAIARFGGRLYLVDASGVVVDVYGPRFAQFDFPIVDGLEGDGEGDAEIVDPRRMALAARLLAQLASRPDVLNAVSQIDVADPHDAVVLLDDDVALLHLGTDRFLQRLRLYAELAPVLREQVRDIDEVDLRFDPRVYVRSAGQPVSAPGRRVADWSAAVPGGAFASRR